MSQEITKQIMVDLGDMSRAKQAEHLGISRSKVNRLVDKYGLKRQEKRKKGWLKYDLAFFYENEGLSLEQISEKHCISMDNLRQKVTSLNLNHLFGMKRYNIEKEVDYKYFESIEFTCMLDGCTAKFNKNISLDITEHKRKTRKFMCSSCKDSRRFEIVHSYTGQ